ncbi:MAG: DUF1016 N-terminal domain-containing protein [Desulfobacterales bacterium]|jgi:hypothetical protein|nr:DUF1016 N-terminal domain-containing protein [Desulfobacterales bacterium]
MSSDLVFYGELLVEIKDRIRQGQTRATLSANAEMIAMYWDIGRMIHQRQKEKGWGAGVIPRLAVDLKNELPEVKGFSERNIGYMIRFASAPMEGARNVGRVGVEREDISPYNTNFPSQNSGLRP